MKAHTSKLRVPTMKLVNGFFNTINPDDIMQENYNKMFQYQVKDGTDINVIENYNRQELIRKDHRMTKAKQKNLLKCNYLGKGLDYVFGNQNQFSINDLCNIRVLIVRWIHTMSFNNTRSSVVGNHSYTPTKLTCLSCGFNHNTESTIIGFCKRMKEFVEVGSFNKEKRKILKKKGKSDVTQYGLPSKCYYIIKKLELYPVVMLFLKLGRSNPVYKSCKEVLKVFKRWNVNHEVDYQFNYDTGLDYFDLESAKGLNNLRDKPEYKWFDELRTYKKKGN